MMISERPALPALTSLRFFAALAIVIHHCNGVFWPTADLGPLDAGVSFFFVLSGFILTYVYLDAAAGQFAWKRFYVARIARVWPLHLVCLLLTLFFINRPEPIDAAVLMANGLMLHAWIPFNRYFFSFNYASWSISTELFFYLLMPLVLRACTWERYALLMFSLLTVLALALIGVAEHLPVWSASDNALSSTGLLYTNPLARCAEFLVGVICGAQFLRARVAVTPLRWRWTVIEGMTLVAFAVGFRFFLHGGAALSESSWLHDRAALALLSEWLSHVGLMPFAALLITVFAFQRGYFSACLSQRLLLFLGEISFALYLVHQLTLRWLQQQGARCNLFTFGLYLIGIIALAMVLHVVIEKPARRWLVNRSAAIL